MRAAPETGGRGETPTAEAVLGSTSGAARRGSGVAATYLRLLRYVRPYLAVLALALACSAVYSGSRVLRAYLLKPLTDDVVVPLVGAGGGLDLRSLLDAIPGVRGSAAPVDPQIPPQRAGAEAAAAERAIAEAELRARLAESARSSFGTIVLVCLALVLVLPVAHFGQIYLTDWTLGRVLVDVQRGLCAKLLSLPLGYHHGTERGEMLSRTTNDATRAHTALDLIFSDVAQSALALALGAALLLVISWQLTLTLTLVGPLVIGVIAVFGRRIRRASRRRQESLGDVTQRLLQILAGIKVIKAFRAEPVEEAHFERENLRYFRRNMKVVKNRALARTFVEALNNVIGVGVVLVGMLLVVNGYFELSLGELLGFAFVMQTTYRPLKDLTKGWTQLMDAMPAADRFFELLDGPNEPPDPADAVRFEGVRRAIRFDGVSFSYGREPVLRDVTLEARAGETVAIVGRTGAGKTTLVDLLLRFFEPDRGAISIDGVELRRFARQSLLDRVAVVTQEPFLFAGTIRENIRYGAPDASDAEVEAAAAAAHVKEFVDALPEGYDTDVGDAGVRLSGGQRQRVTIARAILRDPAILIFDEATSSLDAKSERIVQRAIDALLEGRTVFVIAHRLSTVRRADEIVLLERGRVAAVGTHDELLARSDLYRELVALQAGEAAEAGAPGEAGEGKASG
jgi:subfamily B ATP-binding cassette protein MsbA